ncbi:hypothetical protein QQS21_002420 [Conoideocrella luteorostrata]|uniref:Conserved oligomeric Golgi complex subunit 8 n=1 Tax=Conoideocrella luteorostrata TaxID=1105319 RepID=A0AAJ0G190_9HYPO|nr:hypothetical protein QQS21_002420 [Conoideocrella luteorostrata]
MAEALGEELLNAGLAADARALEYLEQLAAQTVDYVRDVEPQLLSNASQSLLLTVQTLSKKSHKSIVESAIGHSSLCQTIPILIQRTHELTQMVPQLDHKAEMFSAAFSKASENVTIVDRKQALRLLQNSERLVDVMEIPPLLNSAVKSSSVNYSSTLDLYAHVHRLASLYPCSPLVTVVANEADAAVRQMAADLISALKMPSLKLAAGLRTVGWLKRIVPDLVSQASIEEALPAIFLVCRLSTLILTLDALDPLKELADEERIRNANAKHAWSGGQHTERYLKRFIEVFREHSFSIVSVSKSVDASLTQPHPRTDPIYPLPSALASFPLHLIGLLTDTLERYLPNLKDKASLESILTQVLYCAGSLGRLGADFSMLLSSIGMVEWIHLVKRHRLLAGRLESVIGDYRGNTATSH